VYNDFSSSLLFLREVPVQFDELRISRINPRDPKALYHLVVTDLCGERYHRQFEDLNLSHIQAFIAISSVEGLNYEQFNKLLLLFEQDRVSPSFFEYFLASNGRVRLDALASCIAHFRGFAMLCFGDFRFAYKSLSRCDSPALLERLVPYCRSTESVCDAFARRPNPALKVERISRDKTWCLGYIAKLIYQSEAAALSAAVREGKSDANLLKQAEFYEQLGETIRQVEGQGLRNTDIYLTWDYMDVYGATSMRKRWEFEETANFVSELFNNAQVRKLKLRYFDPTQSQCSYRIDKGLVEALMLKRARCTVYMVQESDTMGKDSELASTLAQGKPVIAYVPRIEDVEGHATKLRKYPLDFFKLRFQVLQAEGALDDPKLIPQLSALDTDFLKVVNVFLSEFGQYRQQQPLSLWADKDEEFKRQSSSFSLVCKILSTTEKFNFEKRAKTLRDVHPLSLQVHLETGVANGVLVVRSVDECAEILYRLLTNSLHFSIDQDDSQGCTLLKEKISQSPFRAVTKYEKMANSFWNFYLDPGSKL
jgi:hypothetical protein